MTTDSRVKTVEAMFDFAAGLAKDVSADLGSNRTLQTHQKLNMIKDLLNVGSLLLHSTYLDN